MPDIAHFRKKLQERLAELDHRLVDIGQELESPHSSDWEENATEREGDEVMESLGAAGLNEIRQIKAALKRIEDGEYGECLRCGEEIPAARLEIVPHTPLCGDCAKSVAG